MPNTAENLENNLDQADLRVLLMSLVHLTGDLSWLEAPFHPKRDVRLIPDPGAGLDDTARARILEAAAKLIREGFPEPAITDPGDALMQRMMSVTLGEDVPLEYSPMMREELGFVPRVAELRPIETLHSQEPVIIVGGGISGIALAVHLKKMGVAFKILEQAEDAGGVWLQNRYPGCGVDTPNHAYSYSFGSRYAWSRYFSTREEILDYVMSIVDEYGLREHMQFNTEVTASHWDEENHRWLVEAKNGGITERHTAKFLVSAIGQLSDPQLPNIKGMERFEGISFHSMHWPEGLDVAGKRIAVIGTGATSMQLVPSLSRVASQVDVYQRSPQWVRPIEGYADPISPGARWLLKHMPFYAEWFRFNMFWRYGDGLLACLRKDPDWSHPERSVNRTNDRHRIEMTEILMAKLGDRRDLIEKCTPTYPPYGKRILLDNNWYETLLKPNVSLITEPIREIGDKGIVCADGSERQVDIIVYATGFKMTEMAARLNIHGAGGVRLADAWKDDDPKAYLGMTVPGFPNFFSLLGPNSAPAHGGSAIFQAECQVRYITACIQKMLQRGVTAIDLRPDVLDAYLQKVDAEHETLVWTHPAVSTYYRNNKGRVFSVMPWRFVDYWAMTREPDLNDYKLVG